MFSLDKLGYRMIRDTLFKDDDGETVFKKYDEHGVYIIQIDKYGIDKTYNFEHSVGLKWSEWFAANIFVYKKLSLIEKALEGMI